MRRTSWKQPVIILIAFIVGLIVNLAARQILPGILPEAMARATDLIAVILQILVAAGVMIITVRGFHSEEN